jgi:predicted amidohydrolase
LISIGEGAVLRVALGEYDIGWHDPAGSLKRLDALVSRARADGAELVVLPEMCTTGFTMESAARCEPLEGESVLRLAEIAREHAVHLLAGVATREGEVDGEGEAFYNSALLFDTEGKRIAEYRKQKLFAYAGEQLHYAPGGAPVVVAVNGVRIAPFICFDLRYPELFREVAPQVDALLLLANWPAARRAHWDVLVRARAIENQCYVVAVNRRGEGGGIAYDGGSVAYDPWGERVMAAADVKEGEVAMVTIDAGRVGEVRGRFPFVEDRRGVTG